MKPGRPSLQPVERHAIPVKFYLNNSEHRLLLQEAKAHGMGISAYVRARLLRDINQQAAA